MGGNHSHPDRRKPSPQQNFANFINQKEYVFIAMRSDIDRAFADKNRKHIESLANEIVAHIMDLKQVPEQNLTSQESDRVRKLIYSFEISFAKLKSVYNCDTSFLKKKKDLPNEHVGNSNFYSGPVEPDIVSDITRSDVEDHSVQRRKAPPIPNVPKPEVYNVYSRHNSSSRSSQGSITFDRQSLPNSNSEFVTRSLPLHRQSLPNVEPRPKNVTQISSYENSDILSEGVITEIENTYKQIAEKASKPVKDINEYYQMDKTVFFLYTQLSKLEILDEKTTLDKKKQKLSKDLVDFRGVLGKKAAEFREIEDAIGVLDESIYSNDLNSNTLKSQGEVPITDLDELPYESVPRKKDEKENEIEMKICEIETVFEFIKSKAYKPVTDVNEYYTIDVDLSNLYTQLKFVDTENNSDLDTKKIKLLDSIMHFKDLLDKKVGQFEEIRRIEEDINTLEIMFDSCLPNELKNLIDKAQEIQERIKHTTFFKNFEHKKDLFDQRIKTVLEQINFIETPNSVDESVEPIYGNFGNMEKPSLNSFEVLDIPEQLTAEETSQERCSPEGLTTDKTSLEISVSSEEDDPIYSNFEEIRQGITHQDLVSMVTSEDDPQRDSIYSNIEIVKSYLSGSSQKLSDNTEEHIKRPPRPLPRNYEEKVINELPKQWRRLNEIYQHGKLSEQEVQEVEAIKRQLEMAGNLFQRKIEKIFENFEESVDL